MDALPPPLAFFPLLFSGWVNRQQQAVIDYLLEENRVLRAERGRRRLRLTDDHRRRLAVKGKALGRRRLGAIAGIVTPDTILRWYRRLVAQKYAGSKKRGPGRPRTKPDLAALVVRMAIHANPRRAEEPRPRSRPQHHQGYPQRPRHRARPRAQYEDTLEDVPGRSLAQPGGGRLLHGRGADHRRIGPVLRLLRDAPQDAHRGDRGNHPPTDRSLEDADRPEANRGAGRVPSQCALSHSRPRPALHRRLPAHAPGQRREPTASASAESKPQSLCGKVRSVRQVRVYVAN